MVIVKYVDGRALCRTKMVGGNLENRRVGSCEWEWLRKGAATAVSVGREGERKVRVENGSWRVKQSLRNRLGKKNVSDGRSRGPVLHGTRFEREWEGQIIRPRDGKDPMRCDAFPPGWRA